MGIREHTTYTVECDVCGSVLEGSSAAAAAPWVLEFGAQIAAHKEAIAEGWTDDTTATKCPKCVGVITRQEPWWSEEEE